MGNTLGGGFNLFPFCLFVIPADNCRYAEKKANPMRTRGEVDLTDNEVGRF